VRCCRQHWCVHGSLTDRRTLWRTPARTDARRIQSAVHREVRRRAHRCAVAACARTQHARARRARMQMWTHARRFVKECVRQRLLHCVLLVRPDDWRIDGVLGCVTACSAACTMRQTTHGVPSHTHCNGQTVPVMSFNRQPNDTVDTPRMGSRQRLSIHKNAAWHTRLHMSHSTCNTQHTARRAPTIFSGTMCATG
jgi:hypothetical protein